MAISRTQKESQVAKLKEMVAQGGKGSLVFASFDRIPASQADAMRTECFGKGIAFRVAKKTLIRKAFEGGSIKGDVPALDGQIAVLSGDDPFEPARVAGSFKPRDKDGAEFRIVGGVYEGAFADAELMNTLASIPDRETLYARFLGMLQSPVRQCAVVLGQIAEKK